MSARGAGRWSTSRPIRAGVALAVFLSMLSLGVYAPRKAGAVAVIENSGGATAQRNWLESLAMADDTRGNVVRVTAVVRHDMGIQVDQLQFDDDWDGTANEVTKTFSVTPQKPTGSFNYSRVSFTFNPARPSGFDCGFLSGTRRRDNLPIHMRARTNDGQFTAWVAGQMDVVEDSQCLAVADFPYLYQWSQSATSINPGQSVTFTFRGDDADQSGSNDRFARYHWRVRRLNDGDIAQGPSGDVTSCGDNCDNNLTVSFSERGRYVVEAELGGEDSFENAGRWFWIGAVDVNLPASTSPTVSLSGPTGIVQQGQTVTVNAAVDDTDTDGRVQMIEWDAANDGTFERREVAALESSQVSGTQLQQSINTTGLSGSRTVVARVTDNGAINGADAVRRSAQDSFTFVINRAPVASNQTVNTAEDNDVTFNLNASDPDADTLTYTVTDPPDSGTLTGSGNSRTYSPNDDFFGSDSFAYSVSDGRGGTDTATVTINVTAVNDRPVAQDQSITTAEDTDFNGTLMATDVDDTATSLEFALEVAPSSGSAVVDEDGSFTYTPGANFHGSDPFNFVVCDPDGACDVGFVDVDVTSVNDPPVPVHQDVMTDEDVDLPITLSASDADGEPLIFGVPTGPAGGTLSGVAPNLTYHPNENFFGSDSFTFSVSDGTVTVTETVDITVNPVNDAPVAQDQAVSTDEDTTFTGELTAIDVDDEANSLSFGLAQGPANGSVEIAEDGSFSYTPHGNYNGPDSFTFTVCDPDNACDEGRVDITVNAVNDDPVPDDQSVTTDEDEPIIITLTATDADGDALSFGIANAPTSGTLNGVAPTVQYTPDPDFFGEDAIMFSVSDGAVTVTGTVNITVSPVNDAPTAHDQDRTTDEDTGLTGQLSATDVDDVLADLGFSLSTGPSHGTVVVGEDGSFTYTPAENYHGPDGFVFAVCDPDGACDQASVDIVVASVNDKPTAEDTQATVDEDDTVLVDLSAADVDGDELSFSFTQPGHGTVVGGGPSIAYTPDPNYNGTDQFTFTVSDGNGGTTQGTVSITVNAVNDPPDAIPQIITTSEDTPVSVTLTADDLDGDPVTFAVTEEPSHGTVSGTVPELTYTPSADYSGSDFITFRACDTAEACDTAVISITVIEASLIATRLVAEPSVVRVNLVANPLGSLKVKVPLTLRATLRELESPQRLAGKLIEFRLGGELVCSAVTDSEGIASCGGVVSVLRSVLAFGYEALFGGDADYGPSLDQGDIIVINNFQL